jgi:hypothetical protein
MSSEAYQSTMPVAGSGAAWLIEALHVNTVGNQMDAGCADASKLGEAVGRRGRGCNERIRPTSRGKRTSTAQRLAPRFGRLVEDVSCEDQRHGRQSTSEAGENPGVLSVSVHEIDACACEQAKISQDGERVAQPARREVAADYTGLPQFVGQVRIVT